VDVTQAPSGTVTLMFTDIVGSTALRDTLVAEHGDGEGNQRYREQYLDPHNARIRALLEKHHGFEVKTIGDAFMVAFAQPEDAVVCAAEIQRSLRDQPIGIDVRIGMHTGAATYKSHDYDGHAVNIAARVEALLKGGGRIYCSGETAALAKNAPGVRFHGYGPYVLKGISARVEIFEALWDGTIVPAPPPRQEPMPYPWLTQWVGRERQMTMLEEALRRNKLVTFHGTGGVGKTRTAVETLLARGSGLPRDLVFVPLENAGALLGAIHTALGITEADAPDFPTLSRQLHGGDRLLILDNFESVMKDAGAVPALAATPGVRVLVTSQDVLGVPGESVVELTPMEMPESHDLFISLAQQRDANWQPDDDDAMKDVLQATDGLPYLIEIVTAVVTKRKLRDLATELKTRLTEVRGRTLKVQHASVQACLEWAFGRLAADERDAMPRLAIFAGGFDAETAKEIAETPLASLDVLVDASLLRFDRESGRYSMLPTTRQVAQGTLAADDLARLSASHARWFVERLGRANDALRAKGGDAQRGARRWITTELENVMQAVAWAEEKEPDLFGVAVLAFSTYLRQTSRFFELARLFEEQLRRLDPETNAESWAMTQNNLGVAYSDLATGDRGENLVKATACYEAALRVWTERDFPVDWAMTQNNLGIVYSKIGDSTENGANAIACYEAALRVYNELDFPVDWAMTQNNLGNAYGYLPDDKETNVAKAITCFEAALRVYNETDFPVDWATTQSNLGNAYWGLPTGDRGTNLARAIACYEAALRVRTEQDFPVGWAMTQNNLGIAFGDLPTGDQGENAAKEIACYEAALRVRTERDSPFDWAKTQNNLAIAYCYLPTGNRKENLANAIAHYEAAARGYSAAGLTEDAERARQRAATLAADSP